MHLRFSRSDQRRYVGMPLELPITVIVLGQSSETARLLNLTAGGASIGTFGRPAPRGSQLLLRCGTIETGATLIWVREPNINVDFDQTLGERQVLDQFLRSKAIVERSQARVRQKLCATSSQSI